MVCVIWNWFLFSLLCSCSWQCLYSLLWWAPFNRKRFVLTAPLGTQMAWTQPSGWLRADLRNSISVDKKTSLRSTSWTDRQIRRKTGIQTDRSHRHIHTLLNIMIIHRNKKNKNRNILNEVVCACSCRFYAMVGPIKPMIPVNPLLMHTNSYLSSFYTIQNVVTLKRQCTFE